MRTESFSVEGEDANGRLSLIGYSVGGKSLNPCSTFTEAKSVLDEIVSLQESDTNLAWKNICIVKTTREIVSM